MLQKEYLRTIIFGIEDSLVSTTGLVAGISIGSDNSKLVLLAGIVAVVIEAVSMSAGEYLSDDAVQELDKIKRHREKPLVSGILMFLSYLLAGIIPLAPFVFTKYPTPLHLAVVLAFLGLYLLGYIKGKILHTPALKGSFKIVLIGGLATIVGAMVGLVFRI